MKSLWTFSLIALLIVPEVHAANSWDGLIKKLFGKSKTLNLIAGRETKPIHKVKPRAIGFKGVLEIPNHLHLISGYGAAGSSAQLVFDNQVVCNYQAKSNHHSANKVYYYTDCSDYSRPKDQIVVSRKVELKLDSSASDKAAIEAKIKIIRSDEIEYGIVFPYINASEGQILIFNGEAWVPSNPSDLDLQGLQGETGPQGPQGPRGETGDSGATGPQGPKGDVGPMGLQGTKGIDGAVGATGPQGSKGDVGPMGLQGTKGIDGAVGATGQQGPRGESGPTGPKGDDGINGAPGSMGLQGPAGLKGDKGDRGLSEIAYLRDENASGVNGGTCVAGTWQTRALNTLGGDNNFVTLSGNRFFLQPGKYFIEVHAPAYGVGQHQAKLKTLGPDLDVIIGSTSVSHPSAPSLTTSIVSGEIIVSEGSSFEVQHRCASSKTNFGFGIAASFGTPEIYTQVKIIKKQ